MTPRFTSLFLAFSFADPGHKLVPQQMTQAAALLLSSPTKTVGPKGDMVFALWQVEIALPEGIFEGYGQAGFPSIPIEGTGLILEHSPKFERHEAHGDMP